MKHLYFFTAFLISSLTFGQTIGLQSFATGFSSPVDIVHPSGDSRLFVVEQDGKIKILNPNGTTNATPFLDISSLISTGGERGLLGLGFPNSYANTGFFYVNYTNAAGNTVIAEYHADPITSIVDTAGSILLTVIQPYANHNGGCLRFGPDGYLYIGMGDGGSGGDPGNRAQNLNVNLGKMLRISVNGSGAYSIPPTNPYVGIAGNDEIWAYGLRNPWRFSFNRLNGDLWIADVGQNAIEEIDKVSSPLPTGLNFGWRCYEGNASYNTSGCAAIGNMTMPIAQYTHSNGCSITGGYFYTGSLYPNFANKYLFADYCSNKIGILDTAGVITWSSAFDGTNPTCFGEDINGEIYVGGISDGTIYKLIDTSLSVSEFDNSGFTIYPNPGKSEIFVYTKKLEFVAQLKVYDLSGKLLINKILDTISVNKINTSALQSGIYLINIEDKSGVRYSTKLTIN